MYVSCQASSKLMLKVNFNQMLQRKAKQVQNMEGAGARLCWEPRAPQRAYGQKKDVFLHECGCSCEGYFIFLMDICASSEAPRS